MTIEEFNKADKEKQNEFLIALMNSENNISDYKIEPKIYIFWGK